MPLAPMAPIAENTEENEKPIPVVSALSIKSIQAKRELLQQTQKVQEEDVHLPAEPFTETEMMLEWTRYAQKLGDKGHRIMESYMLINDPRLEGTTIIHELPNEGSRIDFEKELMSLAGYLRGKLHNHEISIRLEVNETIENKRAFTAQDKYNRLNEINPGLELLRRTFDLDFNS